MNKKILLAVGGFLITSCAFAADDVALVIVDPGYSYVGPNYSGYYNYTLGDDYSYVGPNYSGYYNYTDSYAALGVIEVQPVDIAILGVGITPVGIVKDVVNPNYCTVNSMDTCPCVSSTVLPTTTY